MKIIIIVDAYSTGRYLAPRLKDYGYECIHVQSTEAPPDLMKYSFIPSNFSENYIYDGNLNGLLDKLKQHNPQFVIVGSEPGVELADLIAENLKLPHNTTELSLARRNKFAMLEAVGKAGLLIPQSLHTNNLNEVLQWQEENKIEPIVLKPEKSAGADHVYFCHSKQDVRNAYQAIISEKNIFGVYNSKLLAQTFLKGTEYIVNTVSSSGSHYLAEIWRCHKEMIPDAGYISLMEELISFESQYENRQLADYAKKALDALKIQHGAGHFEIMLTEKGPVLIEVAARLQGCMDPAVVNQAMGHDTVGLLIDSYLVPNDIKSKSKMTYQLKEHVYRIFIKSTVDGVLDEKPNFSDVEKLKSFGSITCNLEVGDTVKPTRDIASTLGVIHLIHRDKKQLDADYLHYREKIEPLLVKAANHTHRIGLTK